MRHRLILILTKFQLPSSKCLGTVVKNIFGGHHAPHVKSQKLLKSSFTWTLLQEASSKAYKFAFRISAANVCQMII